MRFETQVLVALLATGVPAFQISLWTDPHCASSNDGDITDSLAHDTCSDLGVGEATSAVVQSQSGDGMNDVVAFWSEAGCTGNILTEAGASAGCVITGDYKSFNVISGTPDPGPMRRRAPVPSSDETSIADVFARADAGEDIQFVFGDSPEYPQLMKASESEPGALIHGKEEFYMGKQIRWHQTALGMYEAIPVEEWDDNVHVPDDTWIRYGFDYPVDFSGVHLMNGTHDGIDERSLNGICDAFKNCADSVKTNVKGFTMNKVIPAAVNAYVKANAGSKAVWNYIKKHPKALKFTYSIGSQVGTGVIAIYLAQALMGSSQSNAVQQCSSDGTQAGAIVSTVTHTVTATSTVTSVQTILETASGTQYTMAFQVTSGQCLTCYPGECGAGTTKRDEIPTLTI